MARRPPEIFGAAPLTRASGTGTLTSHPVSGYREYLTAVHEDASSGIEQYELGSRRSSPRRNV